MNAASVVMIASARRSTCCSVSHGIQSWVKFYTVCCCAVSGSFALCGFVVYKGLLQRTPFLPFFFRYVFWEFIAY
jgi:hypothetical protein